MGVGLGGVQPLPVHTGAHMAIQRAAFGFTVHAQPLDSMALRIAAHHPAAWPACHRDKTTIRNSQQSVRTARHCQCRLDLNLRGIPISAQQADKVFRFCAFLCLAPCSGEGYSVEVVNGLGWQAALRKNRLRKTGTSHQRGTGPQKITFIHVDPENTVTLKPAQAHAPAKMRWGSRQTHNVCPYACKSP